MKGCFHSAPHTQWWYTRISSCHFTHFSNVDASSFNCSGLSKAFLSLCDPKYPHSIFYPLILILIRLIVDNVEEPQLIYALRSGNDTQPVTELLLLEELLCPVRRLVSRDLLQNKDIAWLRHSQVLQVAAREFFVRN